MCDKNNLYAEAGVDYRTFRIFANNFGNPLPDTHLMRALFSQAYLETGNFKSDIWKKTKNAFGMRPSQQREKFYCWVHSTATGKYAGYNSHFDSIQDRLDLDDNFNRDNDLKSLSDVRNYMEEVYEDGYATDPNYVDKWKNVYNSLFPNDDANYENYGSTYTETGDNWEENDQFKPKSNLKNMAIILLAAVGAFFGVRKLKQKFKK